MAPSTFSERFGFARWFQHLRTCESPGFSEIGRAVDRSGVAVSAWRSADEPPADWRVHEPLAAFFGVSERWLIRGEGAAPNEQLWVVWLGARRDSAPVTQSARAGIEKEYGKPVGTRQRAEAAKSPQRKRGS